MTRLFTSVALGALLITAPALAAESTDSNKVVPGQTTQGAGNSGPGVQGPPDTRTGPSTRESGDASSGASTGEGATTSPSQDSSGVEGLPGNKSGSSAKEPSDSSASPKKY